MVLVRREERPVVAVQPETRRTSQRSTLVRREMLGRMDGSSNQCWLGKRICDKSKH